MCLLPAPRCTCNCSGRQVARLYDYVVARDRLGPAAVRISAPTQYGRTLAQQSPRWAFLMPEGLLPEAPSAADDDDEDDGWVGLRGLAGASSEAAAMVGSNPRSW